MRHPDATAVIRRVSSNPKSCVLETCSVEDTERLGEALARAHLAAGRIAGAAVLILQGPLGAGKTSFVRGVARGLSCATIPKSPTFTLHSTHRGERTLHHVDLYRISGEMDLDELGLEELFGGSDVVAVEWGERLGRLIPEEALHVTLEPRGGDARWIRMEGTAMEQIEPSLERFTESE